MKNLTTFILLMTTLSTMAQSGKATTEKKLFSRTTTISETIHASPTIVWALLTNATDYSRWNTTIVSIEGEIQKGEKIKLKSTLDPNRTFKLKIKEMITGKKLVWGDAMGTRTYTLEKREDTTVFIMTEKIGSFMFPLFASKIPTFDESFEQFTSDLKMESEIISQSK